MLATRNARTATVRIALAAAMAGSMFVLPAAPALARDTTRPVALDSARLDTAPAEYSQYRRWRGGNRNAAIAAGVGLGVLGAAAIAASRGGYAEPAYGYGYEPGYYVEEEPVYVAPRRYYGPRYQYYPNNARDPAGGSNR